MNIDKIIPLFIKKVKELSALIPYFCRNVLIYNDRCSKVKLSID